MTAMIFLREYKITQSGDKDNRLFWATVRSEKKDTNFFAPFCYDTQLYKYIKDALIEARAFCKWKKLKIEKIVREYTISSHLK